MLKRIYQLILLLGAATILFFTLFGYFARWIDFAEFVVSLRPFYFLMGLGILVLGFQQKHKSIMILAGASLLFNGIEFAPYYIPIPKPENYNLTVLFYNVDKIRIPKVGVDEVVELVEAYDSELVVLREVGIKPAGDLTEHFKINYPYTISYQHADHDGVLILSQHPLSNVEITQLGGGRQVVLADIQLDNKTVHLLAPHPTNALFGIEERNQQLIAIKEYIEDYQAPILVVGDLNVTMWSGWYKQIERAGVRNVRYGNGIMPTWRVPGFGFQVPFIYLPLDHILVSNEFEVYSAEALPSPGSDHQPVIARLNIPAARNR